MKKAKPAGPKVIVHETPLDDLFGESTKSSSPVIQALEDERKATWKRPAALELAQLAATMQANKGAGKKATNLAERALALLKQCQAALCKEIDEEIHYTVMSESIEGQEAPDIPEWEWALLQEKFPMPFETALEIIIGKKVRCADRHKTFRDFSRDVFRPSVKNESDLELIVETRFAKLKAEGFDAGTFGRAAKRFEAWKKTRLKDKARRAALKRWGKPKG